MVSKVNGVVCAVMLTAGLTAGVTATAVAAPDDSTTVDTGVAADGEITLTEEPTIENREQWAVEFLRLGKWPVTGQNVCAVVGWELAEGGHFVPGSTTFNPLNTSQNMPGATVFNSHGVKNYPNWSTGLIASVKTMQLGFYSGIRGALDQGNNANGVLGAVISSVWGTKTAAVPGACLVKAQMFDEKRVEIEDKINKEKAELAADEQGLVTARVNLTKTEKKYSENAPKVKAAKRTLNQLARQLYVQSAEPEMIALVDGITSGDPVSYAVVDDYVRRAGDRNGTKVVQAVEYLASVQSQVKTSHEKVTELEKKIEDRQQAIAASETELVDLASGILGGS